MRDWLIKKLGGFTGKDLDTSFRCGERMMNSTMESLRAELTKANEQILAYEKAKVEDTYFDHTSRQIYPVAGNKPKRGRPKGSKNK